MQDAGFVCRVASLSEEDRPGLDRFFSEVWTPIPQQKSPDWLDWKWKSDPNVVPERPAVLLAQVGAQVVGILVLVPTPLWVDGKIYQVAWGRDLYVDPAYRRYKLGLMLNEHWMKNFDAALGSGQSEIMRNLQQKHGWNEIARVRQYEKLFFDPALLKRSVGEGPLKFAKRGLAMLYASLRTPRVAGGGAQRVVHGSDFDEKVETLWFSCRTQYSHICARDLKTLRWRFVKHPYIHYDIFEILRVDGAYGGYLVARQQDKVCWLIDLLTEKDDNLARRALVSSAESYFRSKGVTRFVCRSVCLPFESALSSSGYLATTFEQYACSKSAASFPAGDGADWYITAMDSDLDR
jgi:GNAT superfamily N-acetyltransferase